MPRLKAYNNLILTLSSGITNSATSMVVDSIPAGTVAPFRLTKINAAGTTGEIIEVTAVDEVTKTLTIVRAKEGTTASAHDAAAIFECRITKGVYDELSNGGAVEAAKTYATSTTGTDAYAVTLDPAPSALTAGMVVNFKADVGNTGAATLNVNSLGAVTIKKQGTADLATGDIKAGEIVEVRYDGTNFQRVGGSGGSSNAILLTDYATGDGTDETTDIKSAFAAAISAGKPIDLGVAISKFTISESIVIDGALTIYANGAKSIFEQTSWGVPCLEIRNPNVTIIGTFVTEVNTARTVFDGTALTASNNTATVKTEANGDPKMAGSAVYCKGNFGKLSIDKLDVKGYISGLYFGGDLVTLPEKVTIGCLSVENVDFGFFGNGFRNLEIGVVLAKNILRSQGVDEHALYITESGTRSEGLKIGAILCNGLETATSHVVSIKSVNDIYIGLIRGENVGSFFTARLANGKIDSIQGVSNVGDNLANNILIQDGTEFELNGIDITSEANWVDASNRGWVLALTSGANVVVNAPRIKMAAATPSNAFYTSGTGKITINNPIIEYVNAQGRAAFLISTTGTVGTIINDPELIGGSLLVVKNSTAKYELTFDPNKVRGGITDATVVANDDVHNTVFSAFMKTASVEASGQTQPSIRSKNVMKTNNGGATTITQFRRGTNGQEFILIAGDANTTIQNNASIVLRGGADLTPANWSLVKFVWWDSVAYEI